MGKIKSARKQARASRHRHSANQQTRSKLATAERKFRHLVKEGDKTKANDLLKMIHSLADRAAKAHVISPNGAARKKSRLSALLKPKK